MKKRILIFTGYYVPSVKGGGPIQSIKNLVDNLSDRFDFFIITSDRDLGDEQPFNNVKIDKWIKKGNAKVFYTNSKKLNWRKIVDIINQIEYDVIYLNSFFSFKFSIVPILLNKIGIISRKPIVLAPRGEFSPGALGLKNVKKKVYINITKLLGLYNDITWHATSDIEKKDIINVFGEKVKIIVANNLTANYKNFEFDKNINKNKGELKIIFVSRIHPKKNLRKAIEFLKKIDGKVEFNIYGPLEDKSYWSECKTLINKLPDYIKVDYKGVIEHDKIIDTFKQHHVFLFPTLGENFGHVISEALIGGCPVIISDRTPWRGLEKKQVGWDIDLNDEEKFVEVIQYCVDLCNEDYRVLAKCAFEYGIDKSNKYEDILNYRKIFE
jgi:glycosyltransferase involved in cell wall biosynthesis